MGFKDGIKKIWDKIKDYWIKNLDEDHKKISASFGAFIVVAIIALLTAVSLVCMGGTADWGMTGAEIIGGMKVFLIILITSMFGKNGKNGNGKIPRPEENKK